MQTPAPRRQRASGRRAGGLPSRDARGRSGDCGRATRHLPADRGAVAPGSAAAAASTPLACDREGRLVLTARGDWQAAGPLRSRGSPGGFGPTNPHRRGVCPGAKNGMCSELLARPPARPPCPAPVLGEGARASVRSRRHLEYILGSLETRKQLEGAPERGVGAAEEGRSQEKTFYKTANLEERGC